MEKRKNKPRYSNYIFSWDIENSVITQKIDDEVYKYPHIYMMNISRIDISQKEFKILSSDFFRTLEQFRKFLSDLDEWGRNKRLTSLIYIHNLNYDLSYLIKKFKLNSENAIFSSRGKIISLTFKEFSHIEFRDNLALFPKKLEKIGKECGIEKLDYKYDEVRLYCDTLTNTDYRYNENDNFIVLKNLHDFFHKKNYKKPGDLPYTATGIVRQRDRRILKENKIILKREPKTDKIRMQIVIDDFKGGFSGTTISNCYNDVDIEELSKIVGKKLFGVHLDINSEYPSIMTLEKFTYYTKQCNFNTVVKTNKPWICTFKLFDVNIKNDELPPMFNKSHAREIKGDVVVNGKVKHIDECILTLNNEEFYYFKQIYDFKFFPILCYEGNYKYLDDKYIISCIVNDYIDKQILKEKLKVDYNVDDDYRYNKEIKPSLNGKYGQSVMSLLQDEFNVIDGITVPIRTPYITDESLKSDDKRHVSFEQGAQIAIKGRLSIIEPMLFLINEIGKDHFIKICQFDTDSIFLVSELQPDIICDILNTRIERKYKNRKYQLSKLVDREFNNDMALFSLEKSFKFMRTYGAKKFIEIYEDNDVKITVAGLSKERGKQAILNYAKENNIDIKSAVKKIFSDGTMFDHSASGRTCLKNVPFQIIEYNGKKIEVGGALIEPVTYLLSKSKKAKKPTQIVNIKGELYYEL